MFKRSSIRITWWLSSRNIISDKDSDIYQYGIQQLLTLLLNLISFLIIGFVFHAVVPTMLFILFYATLRIYAGGYHASTPIRCYLFSNIMIIIFGILFNYLPMTYIGCNLFVLPCAVFIFFFSPIGSKNKPLDKSEKRHYWTKSTLILLVEIALYQVFMAIGFTTGVRSITLSIGAVCFMMILGCIYNKWHSKKLQQ